MMKEQQTVFFLVEESVVSEKLIRTMEAKKLLSIYPEMTVDEVTKKLGISRSTFYKYKDKIFPFYETVRHKVITLFFVVENFTGLLSHIISEIAGAGANIITINQNIPINGVADITISVETADMVKGLEEMLEAIGRIPGVRKSEILARE